MHPQTLRKYERLGLVRPSRTLGSMRVYTREEIDRLRTIKYLFDEGGINLAGVQRLLAVADVVRRLRPLARQDDWSRTSMRQLIQELDRLSEMLGL
jgi:MerR family transcriptional regulator/heat shock protein HspR